MKYTLPVKNEFNWQRLGYWAAVIGAGPGIFFFIAREFSITREILWLRTLAIAAFCIFMFCALLRIVSSFMDNKLFGAGTVLIISGILTGGFIGLGASASINIALGLTAGCILVVVGALCLLLSGIRNIR